MILVIDNYDSFTFNIVQLLNRLGFETKVHRNDEITLAQIEAMAPDHIVISPGPGNPDSAGVSLSVIEKFKGKIPIMGVCLGLQSIGQAFGGKIIRARKLYHGKTSQIFHNHSSVFAGLKSPLIETRYHSLVIEKATFPGCLEITAESEDGEIMGVRHKEYAIHGVQFHPESIASECGDQIFLNFLRTSATGHITSALKKVRDNKNLDYQEARQVMFEVTSGSGNPAQIGGLLSCLAMKGETIDEITGFASVMRERAVGIAKPKGRKVLDTCGTGGDGSGTFNISTLGALVAASAGVYVAKHGNRSITSKCGSADILEALGVKLDLDSAKLSACLEQVGIAFLFAPSLHPAMKHVAPIRKELGIRTVFNILGPLSNPAKADYQLIGVFAPELTDKMANALVRLGVESGLVVHGHDGLDEITLTASTQISEFKDGWVRTWELNPARFGFDYCRAEDIAGGSIEKNKAIALAILDGEKGPKRNILILNAAAALLAAKAAPDFESAITLASDALDSGKARKKLDELVSFTRS